MKKIINVLLILLGTTALMAQNTAPAQAAPSNIVPNPSFEQYKSTPVGWYYNGDHFTAVMKYWSSPTGTSPDAYSPKVRVPDNWASKGFGNCKAHLGESFVGITNYGCENGKPHCREYLQIQLKEPLVVGQNYYAEFWVNHLVYSMRTNNIGMAFTKKPYTYKTEEFLSLTPALNANDIVIAKNMEWVKISGTFVATTAAEYLIMGNFFTDTLTQAKPAWKDPLTFGYYYIDDVLITKADPIIAVPVMDDDLTLLSLEAGKVVLLKDIYFEYNKEELLPRSEVELQKLLGILQSHPTMVIEVDGHTDNSGSAKRNQELSEKRAKSIAEYLIKRGTDKRRVRYKGFGSTKPVASNENDEGRQLNRRVEFKIIQL